MCIHSTSNLQPRTTLYGDYFYNYFTYGLDILFDGKVCILHSVFASLHGETLTMETPTRRLLYFQTPKQEVCFA